MAGLSQSMGQARASAPRRLGQAAAAGPRWLLTWEDWLTVTAAAFVFLSVAGSIQGADWVRNMPGLIPTAIGGLLTGLLAARVRASQALIHPVALGVGVAVVALAAQQYADGATISERLADFRVRMVEWYHIVRAGDISNDNLPFVTLVHSLTFLAAYLGTWSILRWHNPWLAVLPAGVVLLGNIALQDGQPSTAFVFYLFGAMLLIGRLHLQKRQAEWKASGIEYPAFISLSAMQLTVSLVVGFMIVAWLVPLGKQAAAVEKTVDTAIKPFEDQTDWAVRLFHNLDGSKGGNFHKFGRTLPIKGDVSLGKKELFELSGFDSSFVRGASYEEYTGVGWKSGGRDSDRVDGGTFELDEDAVYEQRRVTSITVHVLDKETTLLFAGTPLATNKDAIFERAETFAGEIEQAISRRLLRAGDTYNAIGSESVATEAELRLAGEEYPAWVTDRYLQLPDSLPARVGELTGQIVSGTTNPYDAALAVESYLRTFPYDLTVPAAPPGRDTVDYLLFDLQRGYFDYNATAMAVMLRTQGIPARIAVGYFATPDPDTGAYVVTKSDAYSWVEVFFPRYGWVNFNPTPDRPDGGAEDTGEGGTGSGTPNPFEDPNLEDLFNEIGGVEGMFGDVGGALVEPPVETPAPFPWWIAWTLAGVLAVLALAALGARISWEWGMGRLPVRARYWAKAQRLSGWAGMPSEADETPREWARRVGGSVERADAAGLLAAGFEEERYGRPDLQRIDDDAVRGAYLGMRGALVSRLFRRREGRASAGDNRPGAKR